MVKIGSANLYGVCINLALTIRSNEAGGLRWIFALKEEWAQLLNLDIEIALSSWLQEEWALLLNLGIERALSS